MLSSARWGASRSAARGSGCWRDPGVRQLEAFLPSYIAERRWFGSKARGIVSASVVDSVPVPLDGGPLQAGGEVAHLVIVRLELEYGSPEQYVLPLACA